MNSDHISEDFKRTYKRAVKGVRVLMVFEHIFIATGLLSLVFCIDMNSSAAWIVAAVLWTLLVAPIIIATLVDWGRPPVGNVLRHFNWPETLLSFRRLETWRRYSEFPPAAGDRKVVVTEWVMDGILAVFGVGAASYWWYATLLTTHCARFPRAFLVLAQAVTAYFGLLSIGVIILSIVRLRRWPTRKSAGLDEERNDN